MSVPGPTSSPNSVRVLVIEPDAASQTQIDQAFAAMNITPKTCADPADALGIAVQSKPQLVVIAYEIQGGGWPLAARILSECDPPDRPLVVMIVDHLSHAMEAAANTVGVHAVIARPVDLKVMAKLVQKRLVDWSV